MLTQRYLEQSKQWPKSGRHILAHYDSESIIVYQAYRPSIADFAVKHQRLGGDYSYTRMSWIKTSFLWMMYRSGWASKEGQQRILAVSLKRAFFDELLTKVVPSTFDPSRFQSPEDWKSALGTSEVRLQWDPDHDPSGQSMARRAIQLGLRGQLLRRFRESELLSIEDITTFVIEQRSNLSKGFEHLITPKETVYTPYDPLAAAAAGMDALVP